MPSLTLAEIATLLHVPAPAGLGDRRLSGMAGLTEAGPNDLSFLGSEAYLKQFAATKAGAVIVQKRVKFPRDGVRSDTPVFVVDDADLAVAKILEHFAPPVPRPPVGRHPSAFVAPSASVGDGARIGFNVFVGDDCRIGKNVVLHPGVYVGANVDIGDNCELFPNVVVRERVRLGNRVIIHSSTAVGSDGFGYRWDGTRHAKVPQIGTVVIEDDVEVGSCVCIDRAKFGTTRVGRGTKIDNLVQVAHNVQIGPHCIIVGQAGIAGSATLGAGVVLGGQCAIRDHITMGDGSMVGGCAGVAEDVDPKMIVSGLPALPHRQSLREQAALRRLPDLVAQLRKLQEEVEQLKRSAGA